MPLIRITVSYDIEVPSLHDSSTLISRLIEEAGKHPHGACASFEFEQGTLYATAGETYESVLAHFRAARISAMMPRKRMRGRR